MVVLVLIIAIDIAIGFAIGFTIVITIRKIRFGDTASGIVSLVSVFIVMIRVMLILHLMALAVVLTNPGPQNGPS